MATKAQNLALIATLNDGGLNTAEEVRNVFIGFTNELYTNVIIETQSTVNTVTSKNTLNSNLRYNVEILKRGNQVTIKGNVINFGQSVIGNINPNDYFFEIVNAEFLRIDNNINVVFPVIGGFGNDFIEVRAGATSNKVYVNQIGANQSRQFTIIYTTNN